MHYDEASAIKLARKLIEEEDEDDLEGAAGGASSEPAESIADETELEEEPVKQ